MSSVRDLSFCRLCHWDTQHVVSLLESLTIVRPKPVPAISTLATTSCTVPHSGIWARSSTGLVFMSSGWLLLSLLSKGSGGAQPDSPICRHTQRVNHS